MANRIAVVVVALVVGAGLYLGVTAVEDALFSEPAATLDGTVSPVGATMHRDRVGRPTVVGEVTNGLGEAIDGVSVTVTFQLGEGEEQTVTGEPLRSPIPSGERAPFVVRLEDRTAEPTGFDVAVTYESGAERGYDGLAVLEHDVRGRSESQVTVDGRVENRGDERVGVRVVATFYDGNGSVVGVRSVPTSPKVLGPGESGQFEVQLRTLGNVPSRAGEVARYELATQAESPTG